MDSAQCRGNLAGSVLAAATFCHEASDSPPKLAKGGEDELRTGTQALGFRHLVPLRFLILAWPQLTPWLWSLLDASKVVV